MTEARPMKDKEAEELALANLLGTLHAVRDTRGEIGVAQAILAHGYVLAAEERERCAELIEANIIVHTNSDDERKREYLAPRKHGDRLGLFYAESIRALSSQSTKGETE